jgi:hypothetical protein
MSLSTAGVTLVKNLQPEFVDTGGKFTASVSANQDKDVTTSIKITLVHLALQISLQILT